MISAAKNKLNVTTSIHTLGHFMFGHMILLIKLQVKLEFGPFVCLCCLALQLCPKVFISQEKGISHSEYPFQLIANDRRKIYDDTI